MALRDQGNFNVPRPNGFFFPSAGKRASSYNIPRPNGFFFPSATGKRGLSRFFGSSHQKSIYLPREIVNALRMQRRSQNWSKGADSGSDWSQWPYIKPRLIKKDQANLKPRLI